MKQRTLLALAITLLLANNVSADVRILPSTIPLHGANSQHGFLVEHFEGEEATGEVQEIEELAVADEKVARIEGQKLVPVADGKTTLIAKTTLGTAYAAVIVSGMDATPAWSFRHHVLPVLAKAGCNSGACHGALAGKGGFRLSLRGYDPKTDHYNITRQDRGRRIELEDPGRSLVVAKPSGGLPHKGGLRFDVESRPYQILSEWIAAGASQPADDDPKLSKLEVVPHRVSLKPGLQQSVLVIAHYSDGRREDVTEWAKYNSTNEAVSSINSDGNVSVVGFGEGAITAWYSSQIVIARVTVPYNHSIPEAVYAKADQRNFIDKLVLKQLKRLNLRPSGRSTDTEFVRRVYIDTIGTLPTAAEVQEFLADKSEDKRDRLIESLLERPEFVDYWSYRWSDLLMLNGALLRPAAIKAYYNWIHTEVENNTRWDEFVRKIVTAKGSSVENGATNFFALHQDPMEMTENTSQAFLGLSIGCARCHNHPLEKWTNNQYFAMANLFARVRGKGWGGDSRNGDGIRTLVVLPRGDLVQPLTGKPQPPTPLDGEPLAFDDPNDRREYLATWLTAADNPYFARSITNRVWANFYGVGLVESVDDMRMSNPASNEELLNATASHLVENDFNLKSLIRTILQSETYQRSSHPLAENKDEKRFYSRYYPRRMMAEVLLDAISQVTDVPGQFNQIVFPGADVRSTDFYPEGTRAIQLYDSAVRSYFLKTFGRNQRRITCECERSDEPSMVQVLHLSNGDTINNKLASDKCRLTKQLTEDVAHADIVTGLFLSALAREPSESELRQLVSFLDETDDAKEKREVLEDIYWSVVTSREFIFNH